jgi:basic membrane protein A
LDNKGIAMSVVAIVVVAIIVIAGVAAYVVTRPSGPTGKKPGEIWVAVVTDVGGRGDMSFNDMGFRGTDLAQAQGIVDKVTEVISTTAADYLPNLRELAASGNYDLIIPIGFYLTDAATTVAKEYPQQNFACIDFNINENYVPVRTAGALGIYFREEQSGALAGVLAGLVAAYENKPYVGIVLGDEIPPVIRYEIGFRMGLYWAIGDNGWYENKFGVTAPVIGTTSPKIIYTYTRTFADPALGKSTAVAQLANNLATDWGVAGATGTGVFTAVEEYHTAHNIPKYQPPFVMGVDADQDWLTPGLCIGSAIKRIDTAVLDACQWVRDNTFKDIVQSNDGIVTLGIENNASGLSTLAMLDDFIQFGIDVENRTGQKVLPEPPDNIKADVTAMRNAQPAWVWEGVSTLENLIRAGTIVVPSVSDVATADIYRALWP